MITTVAFDLDDTLYDEVDYCKSGFAAVAGFLAKRPDAPDADSVFEALWKQFTADNRNRTFNAALADLGIEYEDRLIEELVGVYRTHQPKLTLPDDSREVLELLSRRYTLSLLTDGFLPAQKLKVAALGIERYFKCIIYTEQLGRDCWKPSPAGFQKLMGELGIGPAELIYVADNATKDFIAPNKLGCETVQVVRAAGLHKDPPADEAAAAKHVLQKLADLPVLLERL